MTTDGKRITRSVKRHGGRPRSIRIVVAVPGEIEITEGTDRGRPADVITAPQGTKVHPGQLDASHDEMA
jgi:hypothetical protein